MNILYITSDAYFNAINLFSSSVVHYFPMHKYSQWLWKMNEWTTTKSYGREIEKKEKKKNNNVQNVYNSFKLIHILREAHIFLPQNGKSVGRKIQTESNSI